MLLKTTLVDLYVWKKLSSSSIAKSLRCSEHKVNYWLKKHDIQKRSISEAVYQSWNPKGDPFFVKAPKTVREGILYGMGVGLYWGEGTKANKSTIRLGNSDPRLIKKFLQFLHTIFNITPSKLRFGLQIFGDMDVEDALRFWLRELGVKRKQFFPTVVVTPHRGIGNYRRKTRHGIVTLYFGNRKLRDIICNAIEEEAMR